MNYTRALAVAALATAAVAANAAPFIFDFSSRGTFGLAAGSYSVSDSVLTSPGADTSTSPVSTIVYTYTNAASTAGGGTITLAGGLGTIDFTFTGSLTNPNPNSKALNGSLISFSNGTGILAGQTGTGSISNTLRWTNNANAGISRTTFYGEVVPEPASMAALAIGALAMARKRRSK